MKKKGIILLLVLALISSNIVYANENNQINEKVEDFAQGETEEKVVEEEAEEKVLEEKIEDKKTTQTVKSDEKKYTGWYMDVETRLWYYYDQNGNMEYGWKYIDNKWYYLDGDNQEHSGAMVFDSKQQINGKTYFFDKSGAMLTDWIKRPEGWYYTDQSGAMLTKWQYVNKKWYYLDDDNQENPGIMLKDCKATILEKVYFFDGNGSMLIGWAKRFEGWYYTDQSGAMITGWKCVNGKWYYLDGDNQEKPGLMVDGTSKTINGKEYVFLVGGAMRTGWSKINSDWYYYDTYSGDLVSGWQKVGNKWYYLNPDAGNKMICNAWKKIGNKWYYFDSNGVMITGWSKINSNWYYFGLDGGAITGWQKIDDKWYYFYKYKDYHGGPECAMASNKKIDGYQLSSSGEMISDTQLLMFSKAQQYSSSSKYLILVNRDACKVAIYTGRKGMWKETKYWSCSPGKKSTPTIAGSFKVGAKGKYFDSGVARCHWYTQFKGDYLFHSVLYRRNGTLYDGRLGMKLSHGCVRLDIKNAKWIYDVIPRGTTVFIY